MGRGKSDVLESGVKTNNAGDRGTSRTSERAIERGDRHAFARALVATQTQLAKAEGLTRANAETKYRQYVDYDPKQKQFTLYGKDSVYTFDNKMNLIGSRKA